MESGTAKTTTPAITRREAVPEAEGEEIHAEEEAGTLVEEEAEDAT